MLLLLVYTIHSEQPFTGGYQGNKTNRFYVTYHLHYFVFLRQNVFIVQ